MIGGAFFNAQYGYGLAKKRRYWFGWWWSCGGVETAGYRQAADVAAAPAVAVSRGLSRNAIACGYLRNLGLNSVNIVL